MAPTKRRLTERSRRGGFYRPFFFGALISLSTPLFAQDYGLLARGTASPLLETGRFFVRGAASYRYSADYFKAGGGRTSTLPDGTRERYHDGALRVTMGYGLARFISLYLEIPLLYRSETRSYDARDAGLGDVASSMRFSLLRSPSRRHFLALDLSTKFASGDADIGQRDPARGLRPELPLGNGMTDVVPSLIAAQDAGHGWTFEESVAYALRAEALVEYLTTEGFLFVGEDGASHVLPIGNLRIRYGDEWRAKLAARKELGRGFAFALGASYLRRAATVVESFDIESSAGATTSTRERIDFGASQLFSTNLQASRAWPGGWTAFVAWEQPWWGKNFPIASLAFVESMAGARYAAGVSRAF